MLGRVIKEELSGETGHILKSVIYRYDECGNRSEVEEQTEAGKSLSKTIYNGNHQPIEMINPNGDVKKIQYDYKHRDVYGKDVLKITTIDAQGKSNLQVFDALGRVAFIIRKNAFGVVNYRQDLFYDAVGNQTKVLDHVLIDGQEHSQITTAWAYNAMNQETNLIEAVGLSEQRQTHTLYNSCGQKDKTIQPNGIEICYAYDDLGRMKTLFSSDQSVSYQYEYNKNNQVTKAIDLNTGACTTRIYDKSGRIHQETLANHLTIDYRYDRLDRPILITLPDGSQIKYVYDAAFLKEIQRIKNGEVVYGHQLLQYDQAGQLLQAKLIGNAGTGTYAYDICKRPTIISTPNWQQRVPENGYDSIGRLTTFDIDDLSYVFAYDDLDQLVSEKGHVTHAYQADSLNNRRQKNEHGYQVNALHQLTEQSDCQYKYDDNGNLLEKRRPSSTTSFKYDALNRLVAVIQDGKTTSYTYDAFNRRMSKDDALYLYQGQDEIGCVVAGEVKQLRLLGVGIGAEIGAAVAIELASEVYAPIHDLNGSVVCLINAIDGSVQEQYRYSAFGEEEVLGATQNPWRYASKRMDEETGFIYFGRRYYDPEIGRWITPDPSGFTDGPNLYAYLHHSPLTRHDAYGLQTEDYIDIDPYGPEYAFNFSSPFDSNDSPFQDDEVIQLEDLIGYQGMNGFAEGFFEGFVDTTEVGKKWKDSIFSFGSCCYKGDFSPIKDSFTCASWADISYGSCRFVGESAAIALTFAGSGRAIKNTFTGLRIAGRAIKNSWQSRRKDAIGYVPRCKETKKPLPLPRNKHGRDMPSSDDPHTQIGWKVSDSGDHKQTREWGYDKKPIKTTDWGDHGTPEIHPNPHDHPFIPNPTGGSPKRGNAVPFKITFPEN